MKHACVCDIGGYASKGIEDLLAVPMAQRGRGAYFVVALFHTIIVGCTHTHCRCMHIHVDGWPLLAASCSFMCGVVPTDHTRGFMCMLAAMGRVACACTCVALSVYFWQCCMYILRSCCIRAEEG